MKTMNNRIPTVRVSISAAIAVGAVLSFCGSALYAGETAKEVKQALNIFINADVTKGVPMTIDAKGATTIGSEVEYPGFAFGTYDVDASASSLKMTLATDPS